jgi:hypothetical protein
MWERSDSGPRAAAAALPMEAPHRHLTGCFWDISRCGWHCSPLGGPRRSEAPPPQR